MKFILTTDNRGAIPAHFRTLEITADEGRLPVAVVPHTGSGARPPAIVDAANKLVAQANAVDDLLELLTLAFPFVEEAISDPANKKGVVKALAVRIRAAIEKASAK